MKDNIMKNIITMATIAIAVAFLLAPTDKIDKRNL